jgi:aryl-alcohol dehydrogenase-like predicted oxidoreductase
MGRVNRRQSLRALAEALDHGITVFDTARSYGWGESEAVLGEFARGRRDRMVIITKFGILPPPRNRLRQALKPIARGLLNLAARLRSKKMTEAIRGQIRQRVSSYVEHGRFDVETARKSLDTSLKNLHTDYVDVLFLHSARYEQISDGKVIAFLEKLVQAGKVRAIGASTDPSNADRIIDAFPSVKLVQFENNLFHPQIDAFSRGDRIGVVTNAPFGGQSLLNRFTVEPISRAIQCRTGSGGAVGGANGC